MVGALIVERAGVVGCGKGADDRMSTLLLGADFPSARQDLLQPCLYFRSCDYRLKRQQVDSE